MFVSNSLMHARLLIGTVAYIYWTMLTSLAPSFFYYSVWQLGVAGQEVTLLTTLSPILLAIPPIREWACTQSGRASLWMGGLLGVACYISDFPIVRMLCVGLSNACLSMAKASDWSRTEDAAYEGLCECTCTFISPTFDSTIPLQYWDLVSFCHHC
jgi:hypothetical protein